MQKSVISFIKKGLWAAFAIMLAVVLLLAALAYNRVDTDRPTGRYTTVEDAVYVSRDDADAPCGTVCEYRFTLPKTGHADTLAFFINHHNVAVYIADKCVYRMTENASVFRTAGGTWVAIPLFESDSGADVRVELAPLYGNYHDASVTFFFGSELAIFKSEFSRAIPELLLSLSIVLVGLFLLALALYHSLNRIAVSRIYAIAALALSAGVWRFTYGRFSTYLLGSGSVLMYTLSVVSLMVVALSLLNCVELPPDSKGKPLLHLLSCVYCAVYLVQLALQAAGLLDLRQTLVLIHMTIIISAAILCTNGVATWFQVRGKRLLQRNYAWLLSIGVLADLLLYYLSASDTGMLCTLGAVLCFALLEGIRLLIGFSEQQHALKEMETQLTLSRTTTMMSQIRSHFVFNVLNAISGMCKYDPEKADETVVRFARYLRNNINIMEDDQNIPFSTDLRHLEDYVALEQVRFGDKIEFYTDVEADQFLIPPLILQPVVENAIKHGVSKKLTNGTIILRTRDTGENIVITVEDDGVGFRPDAADKKESVGLRNIRFRLQHLVNGTLEIASEVDKGTTVTITIPKKECDPCT